MTRLAKITEDRFEKIVQMKLPPEQEKYVASNVRSLAQAWLHYGDARPFAIVDGDDTVGFLMLDWDEGERVAVIWRFMIAPEYQHKGHGRAALAEAMRMIREADAFDLVALDYVPGNDVARNLYASMGFAETGEVVDGEIIMTCPLTDHPKVGVTTADEDDVDEIAELLQTCEGELPAPLADAESISRAAADKRIRRYTVMGRAVALSLDRELLMPAASEGYRREIEDTYLRG